MSRLSESALFAVQDHRQDPPAQVLCFPHAGGNPLGFLDWQRQLGQHARVVAVCPAGRAHRIDEPAPASIAELADHIAEAVAGALDRPTILFGHSLGAMVAFEVARRLAGLPEVRHLVASGAAAPCLLPTERVVRAARLTGPAFAEAVGFFGGLPPEIAADEDLQELLLPGVRADFRLAAGYQYRAAAPLDLGLTLINGRDDPHVRADLLDRWAVEVTVTPARRWSQGGHFYFVDRPEAVTEVLLSVVREAGAPARQAAEHVEVI
ncbi:MAG TPA: alpha/beta fold hydrolase [Pseudonocardiaceae bacterium]|nr:alpha/beta fold hydrolase [Pseudonocardiaceae bacterium]